MITGLIKPTSGNVYFDGIESKDGEGKSIQNLLGFCPQESILYPTLTVKQHLEFYQGLKQQYNSSEPFLGSDKMLATLQLEDKADVPVW